MREASVVLSCEVIGFHCRLLPCLVAAQASGLFCKTLSLHRRFFFWCVLSHRVRAFLFSVCVSYLIHKLVLLLRSRRVVAALSGGSQGPQLPRHHLWVAFPFPFPASTYFLASCDLLSSIQSSLLSFSLFPYLTLGFISSLCLFV